MSTNLLMDFSVDKKTNQIIVKREFAAQLPLVWDAYTKSELLDQWWAPKPWKARTKSMDFREGGAWLYAMVGPEGEEHWAVLNYLTIQPQKSFTAIDAFTDAQGTVNESMPRANWTNSFTARPDVTLVESVVTYGDLSQLETVIQMGIQEGLTIAMEGLDELLASLKASE